MSKIRVFQTIENKIYVLTFTYDDDAFSSLDKELMEKYGEPEINMGGTFLSGENEFDLPDEYARIRTDFPLRKAFDSRDEPFDTNTVTKVNGYRDEIIVRWTAALTALRLNSDTFTSEHVYNV